LVAGRIMIADFSAGTAPAAVHYWEDWGQDPLFDGWHDDEDRAYVGDFMGLGRDQLLSINRALVTELFLTLGVERAPNYVGWAPVPCLVRLVGRGPAIAPVDVTLRNRSTVSGGQVVFRKTTSGQASATYQVTLPVDGTPVDLFVGGLFGRPSVEDGDAAIEIVETGTGQLLSITTLMVRVRKSATTLTVGERDRFVAALAAFNDRGLGRFSDFRNVHTSAGSPEAHGLAGFLPWHRAFLLDLERELQAIDPSVALPYWRFDQPAASLFSRLFMGSSDPSTGTVRLSSTNPLRFWTTDGIVGISRLPGFDPASASPFVRDEAATLALGGTIGPSYEPFRTMEGDPHASAHTSFQGFISSIPTAARDPLFFLLHANVDRLWAKWQWFYHRFDATSTDTYSFPGAAGSPGAARVGHNLEDTMWPWNLVTTPPRPPTAPGGDFPDSALTVAPGSTPKVRAMIDYQGALSAGDRLGFDYDDVPFEP
jgi:tyrosinase